MSRLNYILLFSLSQSHTGIYTRFNKHCSCENLGWHMHVEKMFLCKRRGGSGNVMHASLCVSVRPSGRLDRYLEQTLLTKVDRQVVSQGLSYSHTGTQAGR